MGGQRGPAEPDGHRAGQEGSQRVRVGHVAGVHGLKGELKVDLEEIGPEDLGPGLEVTLTWKGGRAARHSVRSVRSVTAGARKGRPRVLLGLEGVNDRDGADALRQAWVWVAREALQLEPGEFFFSDLVGLTAVDPEGASIGEVVAVEQRGQDRVLLQLPDGSRREVPAVYPILQDVRLEEGKVVLDLPAGLLDFTEE